MPMKRIIHYLNSKALSSGFAHLLTFTHRAAVKPLTENNNPLLEKKVLILDSKLQNTLDYVKKTIVEKNGKEFGLHHLPWYMLMGSPNSGKTSLLANSNIKFLLAKKKATKIRKPKSIGNCDLWVSPEMVMVDVPGSYTRFKLKEVSLSNGLWRNLLSLLHKKRTSNGLNGVVIAFSLSDLMDPKESKKQLTNLTVCIEELQQWFGPELSFYITITKCDLLPGFLDFFSDCGSDEMGQAWGVTLPVLSESDNLVSIFSDRFNALIKRLNKQMIWRLHRERNVFNRAYIKDFPLHLERLKIEFIQLLRGLSKSHFNLKGVYLTSASQSQPNELNTQPPQTVSGDTFQQGLQILHNPNMPNNSYFIKQFFQQALAPNNYVVESVQREQQTKIYRLIASVFVIATTFFSFGVLHNKSLNKTSIANTYGMFTTASPKSFFLHSQPDSQLNKQE